MAAVVELWEPPCSPGNTALHITMAPRTHECLAGGGGDHVSAGHRLGCCPPATRPAKWAMSAKRMVPHSSAMARNFAKSNCREQAEWPATNTLCLCSRARRRISL